MSTSLIFKYWSTEINVPVIETSFFNSTQTCLPTNVLKKEKNNYKQKFNKENEQKQKQKQNKNKSLYHFL